MVGATNAADVDAVLRELSSREQLAIVVHCTDASTSDRLRGSFDCVDIRIGTNLEAGVVYVVSDCTLDALLRATADAYGAQTIAVILAGAERNALLGLKRIKEVGGITMAHAAIPGSAIDLVLGHKDLAFGLQAVANHKPDETLGDGDTLRDILTLVRVRTGYDFTSYKRATLFRRISRRMQICQLGAVGDYHRYLRDHPPELTALLRDFLIGVTSFFRDPDAFEALARTAIPTLFASKAQGENVRVWVPGCATGEEVYSIAMLLDEHARQLGAGHKIQVFATDIDDDALAEAREARYPENIAVDVCESRLARYFVRENGFYRISKALRDLVLFSPHNLLVDPPFSRLDLVSCRNLLIYLNRDAQDRVLKLLHFALRGDGILFLGASESAENLALFSAVDAKARIYQRLSSATQVDTLVASAPPPAPPEHAGTLGALHFRLVERYAPPSVLVDRDLDVIHVSEHAGRFLSIGGGEPTKQLTRLVLPELRLDLRTAIHAARGGREETRRVELEVDGKRRVVELRVVSNVLEEVAPGALLVFFDEHASHPVDERMEITDELERTRDQLRTAIEHYETSNEELAASNEELRAINDQLRSATDELETRKQALESANLELAAVNRELRIKVDEISHAGADLENLASSTDIGVLFLDRKLDIKHFTPRARDIFNLIATDIGRPLTDLTHRLDVTDLAQLSTSVLHTLSTIEREVASSDARRYVMRVLPYRSLHDRIDGVVVTFVDVTELRATEEALAITEQRLAQALRTRSAARERDERVGS